MICEGDVSLKVPEFSGTFFMLLHSFRNFNAKQLHAGFYNFGYLV